VRVRPAHAAPKGEDGKHGEIGQQGLPGVPGPKGEQGAAGRDGRETLSSPPTPWSNQDKQPPGPSANSKVKVQNYEIFNENKTSYPRYAVMTGWHYAKSNDVFPDYQHCYISIGRIYHVTIALDGKQIGVKPGDLSSEVARFA